MARRNDYAEGIAIRHLRARSNAAIARHDVGPARTVLHDDARMIGSNGDLLDRAAAMAHTFEERFADPDFVTFARKPVSIDLDGATAAAAGNMPKRSWRVSESSAGVRLAPVQAQRERSPRSPANPKGQIVRDAQLAVLAMSAATQNSCVSDTIVVSKRGYRGGAPMRKIVRPRAYRQRAARCGSPSFDPQDSTTRCGDDPMTVASTDQPELFWISGSPAAWRVLLGFALKQVPYLSRRLDPSKGEHKSASYLSLNPRGQVPTLRFEGNVIRESIAILAFLDARWQPHPLFGRTPARAARVWQAVMEAETALHSPLRTVAQILLRGEARERKNDLISAAAATRQELERWERTLELSDFAVDDEPSAADCVLYPSVAWLRRAIERAGHNAEAPETVVNLMGDCPQIAFWCRRVQAVPGFESTYPPHWREVIENETT